MVKRYVQFRSTPCVSTLWMRRQPRFLDTRLHGADAFFPFCFALFLSNFSRTSLLNIYCFSQACFHGFTIQTCAHSPKALIFFSLSMFIKRILQSLFVFEAVQFWALTSFSSVIPEAVPSSFLNSSLAIVTLERPRFSLEQNGYRIYKSQDNY